MRSKDTCVEKGDMYCNHQTTDKCETEALFYGKEFTNDDPTKVASGAIKLDGGKVAVFQGAIDYFPRAIEAVAGISQFGATKYAWKGWEGVDDGYNRYSNAMVRHLLKPGIEGDLDLDSGLLHDAHCAWNSLARLELKLRDLEKEA